MKRVAVILLWIILLLAIFAFGYLLARETTPEKIIEKLPLPYTLPYDRENVDQALDYLREAREIHQVFIDKPFLLRPGFGDLAFQQMWVERYQYIENLIREMAR